MIHQYFVGFYFPIFFGGNAKLNQLSRSPLQPHFPASMLRIGDVAEATEPLTEPAEGFDDAKDMERPGGIAAPRVRLGILEVPF